MLTYRVQPNRQLVDVTNEAGLVSYIHGRGRGRSAVFVGIQKPYAGRKGELDAILMNARPLDGAPCGGISHWGYKIFGNKLIPHNMTGPDIFDYNEYVTVTDLENDGRLELVTFQDLRIYGVKTKAFQLDLLNDALLPKFNYRGTIAVAEFDFDNDGYFYLYIARTSSGDYNWLRKIDNQDRLLKNMGGKYYKDVSGDVGLLKEDSALA